MSAPDVGAALVAARFARAAALIALSACASAPPPPAPEPTPAEPTPPVAGPLAPDPEVERPAGAAPRVIPVADVVSLSLGSEHACVAQRDGRVSCWGNGATYRLGQGLIEASKRPVAVRGVDRVAAVAAGGSMSCAIKRDATVMCWGGYAQTAGDYDGIDWPMVRLPRTITYPVASMRQVSVGWTQVALLDAAGEVSILDAYAGPVPLPRFSPSRAVAALDDGFCSLTRSGGVECVSSHEMGATGNGGRRGGYGKEPATALAALTWSDALRPHFFDAEGEPRWAPCSDGEEDSPSPSFCSEPLTNAVAIDATSSLACAVLGDGGLACWGCASCFEDAPPPLGLPAGMPALVPFRIPDVADVAQVAVGRRHICTLHRDGAVRCWGDDLQGQLGPLGNGNSAKPTPIPGLGEVVAIDAGDSTTCVLRKDGSVACWGHRLGTRLPDRYHEDILGEDEEPPSDDSEPTVRELSRPLPEGLEKAAPRPELSCRAVDVFATGGELEEIQYRYDRKGRVIEEHVLVWNDGALELKRSTRFKLDRKGGVVREDIEELREDGSVYQSSLRYRRDRAGRVVWLKGENREDDGGYTFKWDGAGRLIEYETSWDVADQLSWHQHPGADGTSYAGLTLHQSVGAIRYLPERAPITTRYGVDADGRVVYRRTVDQTHGTLDTWTTFDAAGRVVTRRHATFDAPFYEDPTRRWEERLSYDDTDRLTTTEVYEIETDPESGADRPMLTKRTVHTALGCL